ncbi:MAG TPA: ABC transporter substrate-binding protein [Candidatus Sulfotelmatobacter sp.]|nr:ABC transporter substrate-binding protein [Candidatus Sulfotelmatobacter sp.]
MLFTVTSLLLCFIASACSSRASNASATPNTLTFLLESNPTNLDPRLATDAASQHIDGLLFSSLLERDAQMNLHGDLAESWETPDPTTWVFHLRKDVRFNDGRLVTSADVKSTFDFIRTPANKSAKRGAFRLVTSIDAPDPATIVFHLKEPYASFPINLVRPTTGIVPANAGTDFGRKLTGSGPFQFVSQTQDDEVIVERNPKFSGTAPKLERVRFRIVPDAIVRALELRKGSGDIEISSLTPDIIPVLAKQPALALTDRPGTNFTYLGVNLEDPILKRREVRQALAYATDREALVQYLQHGQARVAAGILPPNHWAYEPNVTQYSLDTARAEKLLDEAGLPRGANGIRFAITLKTSTDEQFRVLGSALQEQWRGVGVDLELRPLEFATVLSDAIKGNFQLNLLRWVGANNDPDIFEFVFSSKRFPPDGANRGHYRNPRVDVLTDQIRVEMDQAKRRALCSEVQKILADDLPYLPLWFTDATSVHRRSLGPFELSPTGDFDFLARLTAAQ